MEQEGGKAFRKMRLVPHDTGSRSAQMKSLKTFDPALEAMTDSVTAANAELRRRKGRTVARAMYDVHMDRFRNMLWQQRGMEPPKAEAPPAQPPANTIITEDIRYVRGLDIPQIYKKKLTGLLNALYRHDAPVARTTADELVIDGKILPGTSFTGAIRSLYVPGRPAPGTRQLVDTISRLNIPDSLLSTQFAKTRYSQSGSGRRRANKRHVHERARATKRTKRAKKTGTRPRARILRVY